jgi:competence protein ComEC
MLFGLIAGIHGWLKTGSRAWMSFCCCLALLLGGWQAFQARKAHACHGLLVLQLPGETALLQLEGRLARQYIRPSRPGNPASLVSTLEKARQHHRIVRHENRILGHAGIQLLRNGNRRVLIVSGPTLPMEWKPGRAPDLILLTENTGTSLAQWYHLTGCRLFVADGSNAMWKIQQWRKEAEKLPLRLHSTPQQGAFLLD